MSRQGLLGDGRRWAIAQGQMGPDTIVVTLPGPDHDLLGEAGLLAGLGSAFVLGQLPLDLAQLHHTLLGADLRPLGILASSGAS